ncbi:hypothetical protein HKD37_08G023173 [Glycine soja]
MASRKRKAIASMSQVGYDRSRFISQEAWDHYLDNFTNLTEGSIDVAIVKEFYANLYVPEDKSPKQVRVRGHLIKFDVDSLNTFLETPMVMEQGESLPSYSRKDLTTLAQTWSVLSYSNLAPTSHTSDLNLERTKLVYELVMKMNMNLGSLISGQISLIAQSNSSRLGFTALITALCKARGVTSDSLTFESLNLAINLAYIKKNCWNLDEPSVTFPGTQKSKARRSEAPSTSAASTPPTSAPSTSALPSPPAAPVLPGPFAQSLELFMSMLQSLHQGQLLIIQSLQDVVQQRPVMSLEEFVQKMAWPGVQPSPLGGVAATPQVTPEPSTAVLDISSSQLESSAPVPNLPLSQDSPSSTTALELNEHAMDSALDH